MTGPDPTTYKQLVGARYRACRKAAGYETAREFANLLEVEENTLTKWERGESFPDELHLGKFRRLTGVPIDFLYTGDLRDVPYKTAVKLEQLLPRDAFNAETV
jgi:transcriptional regulator with XRE-family HTH domain